MFFEASSPAQPEGQRPAAQPAPVPILKPSSSDKKDKKPEEMFVGGGQAVMTRDAEQVPSDVDLIQAALYAFSSNDILFSHTHTHTHRSRGAKPADQDASENAGSFTGDGKKLEGHEYQAQKMEEVHVKITVWSNGFSIDDSDLLPADTPEHAQFLSEIQARKVPKLVVTKLRAEGKDPTRLDVVLTLQNNKEKEYKKEFKAFSGGGRSLGGPSPVAAAPSAVASDACPLPPPAVVDEAKPATSIQFCLSDGQRVPAKFNLDHTVGDVVNFVRHSKPNHAPFTLRINFPRKVCIP